jgi:hypothetical protein
MVAAQPHSPLRRPAALRACAVAAVLLAALGPVGAREVWKMSPAEFAQSPAGRARLDLATFDPVRLGAAIFHETNRVRRELNLPSFHHLDRLDRAADIQATNNALNQDASHHNAIPRVALPNDRVQHVGLRPRIVAENAALVPLLDLDLSHGYVEKKEGGTRVILDGQTLQEVPPHTYASFAAALVRSWMASAPHRANIVNPELTFLGCSGRPSKALGGFDMVACIQEFYTPQTRD